jgi:putative hydrolase of the HAD superfamily
LKFAWAAYELQPGLKSRGSSFFRPRRERIGSKIIAWRMVTGSNRTESTPTQRTASERCCRVVAFDGDDTLWIDDTDEKRWERDFEHLAVERLPHPAMTDALRRHLRASGYTQKGVQHALRASAREVCRGDVPAEWRAQVDAIPQLLGSLELRIPHGLDRALERLKQDGHALWVITMGDLIRQAIKLACFPLLSHFDVVEIVERKTRATYAQVLAAKGCAPSALTMVGDAFFEDVVPVVRLGGRAIHVPAGRWVVLRPLGGLLPTRRIRVCRAIAEVPDAIAAGGSL